MKKELLSIARSELHKVYYTHVTHEITAKKFLKYTRITNIINFILIALILVILILQLIYSNSWLLWAWIFLTASDLCLIIYEWIFKNKDKYESHKNTALDLLELREDYRYLIWIINWKILDQKDILNKIENLKQKKDFIYRSALTTDDEEYEKAKDFLDPEKKFRWWWGEIIEAEIDNLLWCS